LALVFSISKTAAVNCTFDARSHFVPASMLRVRSGARLWLLMPVAASVSPSVPSNDGVNDVLNAA
jgi:hypothetical protein